MRVSIVLLAAAIAAACALPASATVRIGSDPGGQIGVLGNLMQQVDHGLGDGDCPGRMTGGSA